MKPNRVWVGAGALIISALFATGALAQARAGQPPAPSGTAQAPGGRGGQPPPPPPTPAAAQPPRL